MFHHFPIEMSGPRLDFPMAGGVDWPGIDPKTVSSRIRMDEASIHGSKRHRPETQLVGGFNPSEKYESQLGLLFPIYGKIKTCSKPPLIDNNPVNLISNTSRNHGLLGELHVFRTI